MISVEHVSKFFNNTPAVNDISFVARDQEILVLLGTSGCGKTTTLKMINRLTSLSQGSISIDGKNILSGPPELLRRNIGYVLQNTGLFPHYTVAENIAIVPRLLKWGNQKIRSRTIELMEKLHLDPEYLNVYPGQLSGGQQQRVGFARALIADPPVLLMDEPFGALDPVTRRHIRKEFAQLDEFRRKTIIMVTHDIQEAFELGDSICIMDKGSIIQAGTPADLLFSPANDFVKNFLSDHRLQLELSTVLLNDVWELLGQTAPGDVLSARLSSSQSLWEAMELLTAETGVQNPLLKVVHQNNEEIKLVGFGSLVQAFMKHSS